jgi:hypothetical protein
MRLPWAKGWLILNAALEISRNQVTHFYSRAKNTAEMIKMVEKMLDDYREVRTLYLSWDATSWHVSKELFSFVEEHNNKYVVLPRIKLVPLPASPNFSTASSRSSGAWRGPSSTAATIRR